MIDLDYLQKISGDSMHLPYLSKYGLMDSYDKLILLNIASSLPDNSVVLEVGSFLGASAAIISSACPGATVYSLDTFDAKFLDAVQRRGIDKNTRAKDDSTWLNRQQLVTELVEKPSNWTIEHITNVYAVKFPNIKFIQGSSPRDFLNWDIMLDLYHEDGDHTMPAIANNLEFWGTKVKSGGLIVCHDYRPYLPPGHVLRCEDVEIAVAQVIASGTAELLANVGQFAILKKI
jgi:hypothetical protein